MRSSFGRARGAPAASVEPGTGLDTWPTMPGAIRDFGFSHVPAPVDLVAARPAQAQLGVAELQALRAVDVVAPAEAAELAEPLVEVFGGRPTSGDHLRLPQPSQMDGPSMRAAVGRVLAVDPSAAPVADRAGAEKEARMREVLRALDQLADHIQLRAGTRTL